MNCCRASRRRKCRVAHNSNSNSRNHSSRRRRHRRCRPARRIRKGKRAYEGKMRRHVFAGSALAAFVLATGSVSTQRPATTVQVYKSPTCGCCANWVKHLQQHGFRTQVTETDNVAAIKAQHKIPARAQSCHTAIVDGYVIEGHVPATDVQRLLKERPAVVGL